MNRRQFFQTSAALAAAASASWWGYRRLSRPPSVSLRKIGLPQGHLLRDGQFSEAPAREHDCAVLILGSGAAALSAAWYLARNGQRNFLIAEGFERNGNNAAYRYSDSLAAPSGAHYLAQPSAESTHVRQMLFDFGILQGYDADGKPVYRDTDLVNAPDERLLVNGAWHSGFVPAQDADTQRFFRRMADLLHARGTDGRKLFAIPIAESSRDAAWRHLDTQTFAQWLAGQGYRSPPLLWYLDYCCRDDYGQGIAAVSAYAGLHYFAARGNGAHAPVLTWPDGLNHLSETIRRHAGIRPLFRLPETRELVFRQPAAYPAAALRIAEHADYAAVTLRHIETGETRLIRAKQVVCAMPLMVARRILEQPAHYGFAESFRLPQYAPWLVGNFVLHRFPPELPHSEPAWDNAVYGSRRLGYVVATHQQIRAAKPAQTIFTAYAALDDAPPAEMRRHLLAAQAHDLADTAAQDLLAVYGRRFWRHVSHLDITVRAHAMSVPQPGYLDSPLLSALRAHRSRIVFAHSDLSGYSVFEEASYWGAQAARQILAQAA